MVDTAVDWLGVRLRVRAPANISVRDLVAPGACVAETATGQLIEVRPDRGGQYTIEVEGTRLSRTTVPEQLPSLVRSAIEQTVAESSPHVFIHAACVAIAGRALVIPASSGRGKSTLAKALVEQGATYYSDEYAVLTDDGTVLPFARPIQFKPENPGPMPCVSVSDLGGTTGVDAIEVGSVAITSFSFGATWAPRRVSTGEGVLAVLQHAVSIRSRPEAVTTVVARALESAIVLEGERGEAEGTARLLIDQLSMA